MYILPCIPVNGTVTLSGSARLPGMGLFIVLAGGADRDKMPHYAAFYLGLHSLQVSRLRKKNHFDCFLFYPIKVKQKTKTSKVKNKLADRRFGYFWGNLTLWMDSLHSMCRTVFLLLFFYYKKLYEVRRVILKYIYSYIGSCIHKTNRLAKMIVAASKGINMKTT